MKGRLMDENSGLNRQEGMRTFEDLDCWKACRELRRYVSGVARKLPKEEEFRLKDQMLRASRSCTANIAEGYGRFHYQETIHFCRNARASAYEVLDHFITAVDEAFISREDESQVRGLVEKSVKLLNGYIRFLCARRDKESS